MRFLVVEDCALAAKATARVLSPHGFVQIAPDFESAVRLLAPNVHWDGISLDHMLPDGDGLTLLRMLREQNQHVPVMYLTAYHEEPMIRAAQALNAAFVPKPADREDFSTFIETARRQSELCWDLKNRVCTNLAQEWRLSARERDVFMLLVDGRDRHEICIELRMGNESMKTHIRRLLLKSTLGRLEKLFAEVIKVMNIEARDAACRHFD